jgi:hypothetical protein
MLVTVMLVLGMVIITMKVVVVKVSLDVPDCCDEHYHGSHRNDKS